MTTLSVSPVPFDLLHPGAEMSSSLPVSSVARIGPNAIIQVAETVRDRLGAATSESLLHLTTGFTLATLPTAMVDERAAQALVRGLVQLVGPVLTSNVLREAGHRTGDYLLANRIPRVAQWGMRLLPKATALRMLLNAIRSNAWTFAGSGHFVVDQQTPIPELVIESCPMCRDMHERQPMCDFYAGTFEQLIRSTVSRFEAVLEVECMAMGDHRCRFVIESLR